MIASLFYHLPRKVQLPIERMWYAIISAFDRDADMLFMNYGWADLDAAAKTLLLRPEDEPNRYCIQLYHRVAGAVDLTGLDVLEVGCGRGGGAWYIRRYLNPRSMTGLDRTATSIAFCRAHYGRTNEEISGLRFVRGDAEMLRFDAASFDAIINIESSHCYVSMERFLQGVHRVLRPGGYLLYADHRLAALVPALRRQFQEAGLSILEEECITANVLKALELDDARKQALIEAKVPRLLRPFFNEFAAMKSSRSIYGSLCSGKRVYLRFFAIRRC